MKAVALAGAALCAAVLAGCTSSGNTAPAPPAPAATASGTGSATAPSPALRQVHDPGQVTGTLTGPCAARSGGQLPDPHCTPGAYDPQVTAAVLCAPGYSTRSYRPPAADTTRFKYDQAYPAYSVPRTTRTELDHLVSLELGGANDASNLWPETPPTPNPKDSIEAVLHSAVCSGKVTLAAAQRAIARNWTTAEKVLGLAHNP